jgi:hypothetical protein
MIKISLATLPLWTTGCDSSLAFERQWEVGVWDRYKMSSIAGASAALLDIHQSVRFRNLGFSPSLVRKTSKCKHDEHPQRIFHEFQFCTLIWHLKYAINNKGKLKIHEIQ